MRKHCRHNVTWRPIDRGIKAGITFRVVNTCRLLCCQDMAHQAFRCNIVNSHDLKLVLDGLAKLIMREGDGDARAIVFARKKYRRVLHME